MARNVLRLVPFVNAYQNLFSRRIPSNRWLCETIRWQHTSQPTPELPKPKPKSSSKKGFFSWRLVGVAAAAGIGLIGYSVHLNNENDRVNLEERVKLLDRTAIGGQWELIDSEGKTRKSEDFSGKWCLVYFGFTHCPDICPEELEKMAGVVDDLEKTKIQIQPIFITVDPERDTKKLVGEYVNEFSSKILGLTGSKEQIRQACKAFRVYTSAGPKDKNNDYVIDHTIIQYLINPNGEFVDHYGQNKNRREVAESILGHKKKWDSIHKTGWFY